MKKVLFTATVDSHIKHFHIPYLKMFKEQGYEVHVATNGEEEIEYCDKKHTISFERNPIKTNNLKAIKQLKKIIEEEQFEIIHTHTPMGSVVTRLAAKKARKSGTRVIYTAHGFHFFKGSSILNWLIFYPIEKHLSKYTDDLITINKEDYELAKKKFKKCKNIHYTHGVGFNSQRLDIEMTEQEKEEFRKELGINKEDLVLSYIAELNKNKNQILLIETVKKLKETTPNIKLLLIGEGTKKEDYKQIIEKENLQENIKLLGKRQDIGKLLRITDIYTPSSLREGTPVNVMEAMYMGLPIVAIDNRGHRELIEENKNGFLINKNNKEEFINKIQEIKENKELVKQIKEENINKSKIYIIDSVKEQMNRIYTKSKYTPIRVLQVFSKMDRGGAETMLMNIYRKIDRNKIQFDFVVHDKEEGKYDKEIRELGGRIFYVPKYKVYNHISYKRAWNNLFEELKENTVIHSHMYSIASIILKIAKKFDYKTIAHSHNSKNESNIQGKIKDILQIPLKKAKYVDVRLACSKEAGKWLYGKNKFEVINNAIDIEKFTYDKEIDRKIRKEYDLGDSPVIGHVGRFNDVKNHDFIIDIFKNTKEINKDIKLLLVGDGELKENIIAKIKNHNLEKDIVLTGSIPNVNEMFMAMNVFLFPSKYEGLPVTLIEAQASGLNCLISDVITKEIEITENQVKYESLESDVTKWSEELLELLKNKTKTISKNAIIEKGYDINSNINLIERLYRVK